MSDLNFVDIKENAPDLLKHYLTKHNLNQKSTKKKKKNYTNDS